jgi:hypothetical protein
MNIALLAEFESADALLRATHVLGAKMRVETFAPIDLPAVDVTLKLPRSPLAKLAFGGGMAGFVSVYALQWWTSVHAYPQNVGGRPANAVPAFMPIAFECAVLGAAIAAFFGLMIVLRFPRLWAAEDDVDGFERASIDRYWLRVDTMNAALRRDGVEQELLDCGALRIVPVDDE